MKYRKTGLDAAIASLKDNSPKVRLEVLDLLEEKLTHPKVKALLGKELKLVNNKLIKFYREEFETVTVNAREEVIKRELAQANYFAENLGDSIKLKMVSISWREFFNGFPRKREEAR
jgi:hypothetical protein